GSERGECVVDARHGSHEFRVQSGKREDAVGACEFVVVVCTGVLVFVLAVHSFEVEAEAGAEPDHDGGDECREFPAEEAHRAKAAEGESAYAENRGGGDLPVSGKCPRRAVEPFRTFPQAGSFRLLIGGGKAGDDVELFASSLNLAGEVLNTRDVEIDDGAGVGGVVLDG